MDEEQFKQLKLATTPHLCPFEKSIQQRRYDCRAAKRLNIGERETVACGEEYASRRCAEFLTSLRDNSGFAMRVREMPVAVPYRQLMQLQLGGLYGLAAALSADMFEAPSTVARDADIVHLMEAAEHYYGGVEQFPYPKIMQALVHTQVRPRSRRR